MKQLLVVHNTETGKYSVWMETPQMDTNSIRKAWTRLTVRPMADKNRVELFVEGWMRRLQGYEVLRTAVRGDMPYKGIVKLLE